MYVAILPDAAKAEAGGSVRGVAEALHQALGREGTYAVVAGHSFYGDSTTVAGANGAAKAALEAHSSDGVEAILLADVDRVGSLASGGSGSGGGGSGGGGAPSGAGLGVIALLAVGGGAFALSRSRRRRRQDDAEFAEVKDNTRDDLVALGDDIRALDLDVQMPGADPRGTESYAQAVGAYERANAAWNRARRPQDLEPVGAALEEGRWAMAAAKAQLQGRPAPERRPPCFFDPRHGPSVTEALWAPPGGQEREVPVCAADAARLADGEEPDAREVLVGGRAMPYYAAPAYFGPSAGGFYGGGGMFLPGLLAGTLLGGSLFGPGVAFGGGWGGDGDLGGGDFGGGDGGGFDVGGGDFGGGDFGGGGDF
jgi:hypothetical protein